MNLLILLFLLAVGIFLLIRSSGYLISALSAISKQLHLSKFVISFLLLSLATSLPELSVGINAAIAKESVLSLGDVLGTNIVNIALILGLVAIIGGGIKVQDYHSFKQIRLITLVIVVAPFLLLLDGTLSRLDGVLLLGLFVFRLWLFAKDNGYIESAYHLHLSDKNHSPSATAKKKLMHQFIRFFISAVVLIGSAYLVVSSVVGMSELLGVSSFVIGLFVVAIGTSLPELMIGLRSVSSHSESISVGNIFGAITINASLVLGIVAIIHPIQVESFAQYLVPAVVTLLSISLVYWFLRSKHTITRPQGLLLIAVYIAFIIIQAQSGVGF